MNYTNIEKLILDIPTKLCRNMSQRFVNAILKDITTDFSQHHFMILKELNEKKLLYVTEIVDLLSITKSQMTASVDKLLSLGYVERKNDSKDRRKIYLSITKEGIDITSKIKKNIEFQLNKNLKKLSPEELNNLENGLKVLYKFCSSY